MTEDENAEAQARAERLADLVESPDLREELLTLAREWREFAWEAATNVALESRVIPSGDDGRWDSDALDSDEAEPPSRQARGGRAKASH
jgi:hypothetical protein